MSLSKEAYVPESGYATTPMVNQVLPPEDKEAIDEDPRELDDIVPQILTEEIGKASFVIMEPKVDRAHLLAEMHRDPTRVSQVEDLAMPIRPRKLKVGKRASNGEWVVFEHYTYEGLGEGHTSRDAVENAKINTGYQKK